jgi:NAD(P)-dependent dehydrogenase (short-subunit alcohol dehydrogenase family)
MTVAAEYVAVPALEQYSSLSRAAASYITGATLTPDGGFVLTA